MKQGESFFPLTTEKKIKVPCPSCNRETNHSILLKIKNEKVYHEDIFTRDYYQVVQCSGCDTYSFVLESYCSEDIEIDPKTGDEREIARFKYYPRRIPGLQQMADSNLLTV